MVHFAELLQRFCRQAEIPDVFATSVCCRDRQIKPLFFARKSLLYLRRGHCTAVSNYVAKASNSRQQNQIRSTVYRARFS